MYTHAVFVRHVSAVYAFLLLFAGAGTAVAQSVDEVISRSNYEDSQAEEIRGVFDRARSQDVPEELLLPRLQEGIAKRVPAGRVRQALEQDLDDLLTARDVLRSTPGGERILEKQARWARAANLLGAGHDESVLEQLARSCGSRPEAFRQATTLYVSLVDWGLESESAIRLVRSTVTSRLEVDEFAGITKILAAGRQSRIRPAVLVERLVENLERARNVEQLEAMILGG